MQRFRHILGRSRAAQKERLERWLRHPFGLPIFVFVGLVAASGIVVAILVATHHTATFHPDTSYIAIVSHDHVKQTVPTREPTVGALLHKLNIKVSSRDRVEPSLATPIVQDNFRINVYRAVPVTIDDGKTVTHTFSAAATPRAVMNDIGSPVYPEDVVTAEPVQNFVSQQAIGERIVVDRSVPVTMNVYGTMLSLRTHAKTVHNLLASKNVKLTPADSVLPTEDQPITPNMQVFVVRKGTQIVSETKTIPMPVQTITDASLSFGTTALRQQGSNGTQVLTYQVNTQNGKEVSRTLLQAVTTVQAVPQIIARGKAVSIPADKQAVMAQAGIASSDYPYVDYIVSHESGWCPTKVQGQVGICPGYAPASFPLGRGYGLVQATPGTKMASAGADWATNPVTQLRWATGYARGRYGSWGGAYEHWLSHHNW